MTTPRHGHKPIEMRRVDPEDGLQQVGDFYWSVNSGNGKRRLVLAIPDKEFEKGWGYSRWSIDHPNHCNAQWSWDGNEDKPTLTPSLHAVTTWHGWVRNGQLVEA